MGEPADDQCFIERLASPTDPRWHEYFRFPLHDPADDSPFGLARWLRLNEELRVVQPFDWPSWLATRPSLAHGPVDPARLSTADAVRLITAIIRDDRCNDGVLAQKLRLGTVHSAVQRLWHWYRAEVTAGHPAFVDDASYSDAKVYRWWYERRWDIGPTLCFVGLNPATGDTDKKPRPTLRKVVEWAKREGCGAVVVVNLFALRATNPRALLTSDIDIIGPENDAVIREKSRTAHLTLVAWGAHKAARERADSALRMLTNPLCAGVTTSGAPRHPLYVPKATRFVPYPPN